MRVMTMIEEELADSRNRYLWKMVNRLDILHSELASLYRMQHRDPKQIKLIWASIDELELTLLAEGVDYESYAQLANKS